MKRKPIMLDAPLVDELKKVANKHGMTLSSYMRSLISNTIEAENKGVFAPLAIRKAILVSRLRSAGLLLLPLSLLKNCKSDGDNAFEEGKRIGLFLRSINIPLEEAIDLFIENIKIAIREDNRVILIASSDLEKIFIEFLRGVASSYDVNVRSEGDLLVIEFD
ncbi:hypothetical protein PYJP_03030 [Pyrofollis japonicus]|uniref:hypothetical protein n=1 Tax=Pyrofollis japonicus TaxID=3060460 RepID=UPI00295C02E0|nr:hypothetical protein [Pyrofollis japonicus]BEP16951.1 hypothetical protein PYJP_03030 [Pyrofollis japonicus]